MIRTLFAVAALAAIASPAAADITVKVAGKDAATVQAEITRAADTVCREMLQGSVMAFSLQASCAEAAKKNALAALASAPSPAYAATTPLAVTRVSN